MSTHKWIIALILASFLALPATVSMAQQGTVVDLIVIPCLPGQKPDECGVKVSVSSGSATFTSNSGETTTVTGGNSLTVTGTGVVTQSQGSVVNFAAVASGTTTGSVGGGGGGSGQTTPTTSGGPNTGPPGPTGTTPTGTTSTGTTPLANVVTLTTTPSVPPTLASP